jgi:hypothetical protein
LSIDNENLFEYEKVINFINEFKLKEKIFFNLVINPGYEELGLSQFTRLYDI